MVGKSKKMYLKGMTISITSTFIDYGIDILPYRVLKQFCFKCACIIVMSHTVPSH